MKCDVALPCATQNELNLEDAKMLVANGSLWRKALTCPPPWMLPNICQENGVLFAPGKVANAGGVATSALEMSQNSERLRLVL